VCAAILLCWGWRTAHVLSAAVVIEGRKRLGQQPSRVTWGSARYRRWKEAEELEVQVMETFKRVLEKEHFSTVTSMGNLASTF
jgi:hypothetical protein